MLFETTATEIIELAPALRVLFANQPVVAIQYSSTAAGDIQNVDGVSNIPEFQYQDLMAPALAGEEYAPLITFWRSEVEIQLVSLTTRDSTMPPGSLPLGEAALGASGAPVTGRPTGQPLPTNLLDRGGYFDQDHLNRAMMLIAQAILDAAGCTTGLLGALARATTPRWLGLEDSNVTYHDPEFSGCIDGNWPAGRGICDRH